MQDTRLILYLILVVAAYGAVLLAREDWRWHLARIIQFGLAAAVCLTFILSRNTGARAAAVSLAAFALFVVIPIWLPRRVWRLILSGDRKRARRLHSWMPLLCWGQASRGTGLMLEAATHLSAGDAESAQRAFDSLLDRRGPNVRRRLMSRQLSLYLAMRQWRAAIELFEDRLSAPGIATATMLYEIVRAYGEVGQLHEAVWCLKAAETCTPAAPITRLHRIMAFTEFYAFGGCLPQLRGFFGHHKKQFRLLPPPFQAYWLGICHKAKGDARAALAAFEQAFALAGPRDSMWRDAVRGRAASLPLAHAEQQPEAAPLSEELLAEIESLRPLEPRRGQALPLFGGLGRVTALLIGLNVLILLIVEMMGSTSDPRDLVRFGANVPALVKEGEYWRLVSSMFLHVGFVHLLFNSYGCYLLGTFLERISGSARMFIIYMLSGLAGSIASSLAGKHAASAGASGAIFGLLGASIVVLAWHNERRPIHAARRFDLPRRLRRLYVVNFIILAILNLLLGLAEPQIDNWAHGGGFAAGILVTMLLVAVSSRPSRTEERPGQRRAQAIALSVAAAVLMGVVFYAGYMAAANVLRDGPPPRPRQLETRDLPDLCVRLDVPPSWREIREEEHVFLVDPRFNASLAIARVSSGEARPAGGKEQYRAPSGATGAESSAPPGEQKAVWQRLILGDRIFNHSVSSRTSRGRRLVVAEYQTLAGDYVYVLVGECDEQNRAAYMALFRRIVASLQVIPPTPRREERTREPAPRAASP